MRSALAALTALACVSVSTFSGSAIASGEKPFASEPVVCLSKNDFKRWLRNGTGDRDSLSRRQRCFEMPADWQVIESDESTTGSIVKWTVSRPGRGNKNVWTDRRIGDPAD